MCTTRGIVGNSKIQMVISYARGKLRQFVITTNSELPIFFNKSSKGFPSEGVALALLYCWNGLLRGCFAGALCKRSLSQYGCSYHHQDDDLRWFKFLQSASSQVRSVLDIPRFLQSRMEEKLQLVNGSRAPAQ